MSEETPRLSRRQMREQGLLNPITDGTSPIEELTMTQEIDLGRLSRRQMRELEKQAAQRAAEEPEEVTPQQRRSVFDRFDEDAPTGTDSEAMAPSSQEDVVTASEHSPADEETGADEATVVAEEDTEPLRAPEDATPVVADSAVALESDEVPRDVEAVVPDVEAGAPGVDATTPEAAEFVDRAVSDVPVVDATSSDELNEEAGQSEDFTSPIWPQRVDTENQSQSESFDVPKPENFEGIEYGDDKSQDDLPFSEEEARDEKPRSVVMYIVGALVGLLLGLLIGLLVRHVVFADAGSFEVSDLLASAAAYGLFLE